MPNVWVDNRSWFTKQWYDIVDAWNGVTNYEPGEFEPGSKHFEDFLFLAKVGLIGYLGVYAYSEIKSPTKKSRNYSENHSRKGFRKRVKYGNLEVG